MHINKGGPTCFLLSTRLLHVRRDGQVNINCLQRLAHQLSLKRDASYSNVISWFRCQLNFALVRAQIMCLRGCRFLHSYSDIDCPASIAQCVIEECTFCIMPLPLLLYHHHQHTYLESKKQINGLITVCVNTCTMRA